MSEQPASLVRYDAMCRAIDAAFEVDEVKGIRDKARAMEVYAQQALNTEAERRACEIRLRAERKAGELRRKEEKNKGGNPSPIGGEPLTNKARREQLGISKKQDEQWQALAAVSEEEFEDALSAPDKPTTNGILRATSPAKRPPMDGRALWLWGRLQDFEREKVLAAKPSLLLSEMTDPMRADVRRLAPLVIGWLEGLDNDQ